MEQLVREPGHNRLTSDLGIDGFCNDGLADSHAVTL